jgi:hypothetical protein
MAAISDYLESKILSFMFRSETKFLGDPSVDQSVAKPANISIALLNTVPLDSDTGATMNEVQESVSNSAGASVATQYARQSLGQPKNSDWNPVSEDNESAYYAYSEQVDASGFYYPLYLSQSKASSGGNVATTSILIQEFPNVTFYKPDNQGAVKSDTNPDPTEIIYRRYDGNGFIQNTNNITFNQAGFGGWGDVRAIALMDSSTYGEGNILMYAALEVPKTIGEGDVVQFIPSQLEISLK